MTFKSVPVVRFGEPEAGLEVTFPEKY